MFEFILFIHLLVNDGTIIKEKVHKMIKFLKENQQKEKIESNLNLILKIN